MHLNLFRIRVVAMLFGLTLHATSLLAADASVRPNIVFILADDWGWGDLSCHGNKLVNTPNLDRLAREGTEFYQFNVGSPVCSPSRVAFMTGRFPARFGVHEAIGGPTKNREVGQVDWLDPHAVTLPRLLKNAGYATGHFGKWHFCARIADAPMPIEYGVEEHAVWTRPRAAIATDHRKVFEDAVAFLRRHKDQPFYLNLWIKETHLAHDPSEESRKEHAHLDEQQRIYSAVVADGEDGLSEPSGLGRLWSDQPKRSFSGTRGNGRNAWTGRFDVTTIYTAHLPRLSCLTLLHPSRPLSLTL